MQIIFNARKPELVNVFRNLNYFCVLLFTPINVGKTIFCLSNFEANDMKQINMKQNLLSIIKIN